MTYHSRIFIFSTIITLIAGCAQTRDRYSLLSGIPADFDQTEIATHADKQEEILKSYAKLAGLNGTLPSNGEDWKPVVESGLNYIDFQCTKYIDALFWWDRSKNTSRSQTNIIGTAASGFMGLTGVAAKEIAMTAVAFGLTGESIDNIANSVLYRLQPSGIRGIIDKTQITYKDAIKDTKYTNRTGAVRAIAGYLSLCLPPTIEANVNDSITGAKVKPDKPETSDNQAPVVTVQTGEVVTVQAEPSPTEQPRGCQGNECTLDNNGLKQIQHALCIPKPSGAFDAPTNEAIALFRKTNVLGNDLFKGKLHDKEISLLTGVSGCTGFSNAYERFFFGKDANRNAKKNLADFSTQLSSHNVPNVPANPRSLDDLRPSIKKFEEIQGLKPTGILTPELHARLSDG